MSRLKSVAKSMGADALLSPYRNWMTKRGQHSWSQEGEDRVLARYFEGMPPGFYVDVGAHHPYRFSNTALLHRQGWRGINIDAMPGSMESFRKARPEDVNLEIGIADACGVARFYVFNEKALNTFDPDIARAHTKGDWRVEREIEVPLMPLADVLAQHVPAGQVIDLLTVDAEGRDLQVLRSNDWSRWRPRVVLAESLGQSIETVMNDPCAQFLLGVGYIIFAKTVNTVMYVDQQHGATEGARDVG